MEHNLISLPDMAETLKINLNYSTSDYTHLFSEGYYEICYEDDDSAIIDGNCSGREVDDEDEPLDYIYLYIKIKKLKSNFKINLKCNIVGELIGNDYFESIVDDIYRTFNIDFVDSKIKRNLVNKMRTENEFNINIPFEDVLLYYLQDDPSVFKKINNPSKKFLIRALRENIEILEYIETPSKDILKEVFKENWLNFYKAFNLNISYDTLKILLGMNGSSIDKINNPNEELQLIAVNNDMYAIRNIKNPSEEIKMAAVKAFPGAIQYIQNSSEEIQLTAVRREGWAIQYIKDPSDLVKFEAIKKDYTSILYIKNPSDEMKEISKKIYNTQKK